MASVGLAPSSGLRESANHAVDKLPEEMSEMKIRDDKRWNPRLLMVMGQKQDTLYRRLLVVEMVNQSRSKGSQIFLTSGRGCVLAEMLLGQPLFRGESGVDQLVEIMKILGTPTREEIKCMNPNYTEFKFPQIKAHPWHKVFHKRLPPEAVDLVSRLLQYSPNLRCSALDALTHKFFDELRDPNARLPNGRFLPPLCNFKSNELKGVPTDTLSKLIPEHARKQCPPLAL